MSADGVPAMPHMEQAQVSLGVTIRPLPKPQAPAPGAYPGCRGEPCAHSPCWHSEGEPACLCWAEGGAGAAGAAEAACPSSSGSGQSPKGHCWPAPQLPPISLCPALYSHGRGRVKASAQLWGRRGRPGGAVQGVVTCRRMRHSWGGGVGGGGSDAGQRLRPGPGPEIAQGTGSQESGRWGKRGGLQVQWVSKGPKGWG